MPRTEIEPELGLETVVDGVFYRNCVVRAKVEPDKWSGAIAFNNSMKKDSSVMADLHLWEELHKDRRAAYERGKRCAYSVPKTLAAIDDFANQWRSFSNLLEAKRSTPGYEGFFCNGTIRSEFQDIYIADLKDMLREGAEIEMKQERRSRWYLTAARILAPPIITIGLAAALVIPYVGQKMSQMKQEQIDAEERMRHIARSYIDDAKDDFVRIIDEYIEKNRDKIVNYDSVKAKIKEAVKESFSDPEMTAALKQALFGFGK